MMRPIRQMKQPKRGAERVLESTVEVPPHPLGSSVAASHKGAWKTLRTTVQKGLLHYCARALNTDAPAYCAPIAPSNLSRTLRSFGCFLC